MSGGRDGSTGQAGGVGQQLSPLARFVVYGLVGWCIECLFTSVVDLATGAGDIRLRGYSYLWMHPIWGAGLLLGERLVVVMQRAGMSRLMRASVGMLVCFAVEYVTGAVLVAVLGVCPWDYSASWFSVQGLIRLDYAPFWFGCALMCEPLFGLVRRVRMGTGEPEPEVDAELRPLWPGREPQAAASTPASLYAGRAP
ncbi:putative ABC transporter permease [Hyalangium rubrum]|uniref:ABC transporter permease n=1 Tax=Hyalangium rubrum TaxID=3103134 RepID=A0ABU5HDB7_9BACT|nr:putative ABC transporter permease [Hyalangium sp. s54d21]MDY7231341.1 putative ABC transporter permease [Hyalangium sp. s54d21]